MPSGASARGDVSPSYPSLHPLAMDDTIPFSQETKPMDSPLGHPYAQSRKCQSTSIPPLAAHFPPVRALPIKDLKLGSWHSGSSMGLDHGPVTAFVSFMELLPSEKLEISPPPAVAPHGCPYVKHGSGITVILSGHKAGTSLPLYPSGSSISGVVVLSKLESVESLDVKVGDPFIRPVSRHAKLIFSLVGRIHLCTRNPGWLQE
jgi:hypothetical protein